MAQKDYRPGFIISNTYDTVHGWIAYRGDIQNSQICFFKQTIDENAIEYKPFEILGYRFIDDKFYISKEANINGINESRFFEYLLHGIVNLYAFKDVKGYHYYIQKDTCDLIELENNEVIRRNKEGVEYITNDKKYIGGLKYIFSDAPLISDKIENVILNHKSLINISMDYHNQVCDDWNCIVYKKKLPKVKISIGPLIGIGTLSIDPEELLFNNPNSGHIDEFDCNYEKSTNIIYGIYTNILLPYSNGRLMLQYENLVKSSEFHSSYLVLAGEYDYTISSTYLSHYLFLRYNIFKKKLYPFFQLGGYLSHNLATSRKSTEQDHYLDFIFPNRTYFGFSTGLGISYQFAENRELFITILLNRGDGLYENLTTKELNLTIGIPILTF